LGQPLKQALRTAARLGAEAVEIDARSQLPPAARSGTGLRALRGLLNDLNLRVAAVGFPTRRGYDVPHDLERRLAATKAALKLAYDLRAPVVINQVGRVPAEPAGRSWELLVESLTDLAAYGQHVGARLAAQTGTDAGTDLARLLVALPAEGIGVDFDPGNLLLHGHSPSEALAAVGRSVLHVHARDAARDLAARRSVEVPLGRGMADFPALLGALEEHGYRGPITVVASGTDPAGELADALSYLRSLME
jgi:sugar phosphate isomerase/epimerase